MYEALLAFTVGLAILLYATQRFVRLAERISVIFKISPLIVGLTVVAIGTSLPELVVSVIALTKQDPGLAMGNIIGSNIVNILMVFPVGLFIGKLKIGTAKTQRNALFLLAITLVFMITQLTNITHLVAGSLLIGIAILVSTLEYKLGVFGREHEDAKLFHASKNEKLTTQIILLGLLLVSAIIFGGFLVVNSIENISIFTGITTTILGLTLTAIATSLPELLTTVFSQNGNQEKITVGNILGSNMYNLSLIGGIIAFSPLKTVIHPQEWAWLSVVTIGFVVLLRYFKGRRPPKIIGVFLLLLLALYLFMQK